MRPGRGALCREAALPRSPAPAQLLTLVVIRLLSPLPFLQLPGWSQGPEGSLIIALGNEDALGEYSCTPYNSLGTAGPSPVTRVLLKVRPWTGQQHWAGWLRMRPGADTCRPRGVGQSHAGRGCHTPSQRFLHRWCRGVERETHTCPQSKIARLSNSLALASLEGKGWRAEGRLKRCFVEVYTSPETLPISP